MSKANYQYCDTLQRENCSEVRGELEVGTLVTKEIIIPTPMPQTLYVRVLERYEFDAIAESDRDDNTLYLIRG